MWSSCHTCTGWAWVTVVAKEDMNELTQKSLSELTKLSHVEILSLNGNHFNKDAQGPFIELVCSLRHIKEVHIKLPEVQHLVLGRDSLEVENAHLDAREI